MMSDEDPKAPSAPAPAPVTATHAPAPPIPGTAPAPLDHERLREVTRERNALRERLAAAEAAATRAAELEAQLSTVQTRHAQDYVFWQHSSQAPHLAAPEVQDLFRSGYDSHVQRVGAEKAGSFSDWLASDAVKASPLYGTFLSPAAGTAPAPAPAGTAPAPAPAVGTAPAPAPAPPAAPPPPNLNAGTSPSGAPNSGAWTDPNYLASRRAANGGRLKGDELKEAAAAWGIKWSEKA